MRVRAFAELTFRASARLSFARACERLERDASLDHPEGWVVDDRRISVMLEAEMTPADLVLHQQLFQELAREAAYGEASIDADGQERVTFLVGNAPSGIPQVRASASVAMDEADTDITAIRHGRS